jgi:hypothetical protein
MRVLEKIRSQREIGAKSGSVGLGVWLESDQIETENLVRIRKIVCREQYASFWARTIDLCKPSPLSACMRDWPDVQSTEQ